MYAEFLKNPDVELVIKAFKVFKKLISNHQTPPDFGWIQSTLARLWVNICLRACISMILMDYQGIVSDPGLATDDDTQWYHDVVSTLAAIDNPEVRRLMLKYSHLKNALAAADALLQENQGSSSDADYLQPESPSRNTVKTRAAAASGELTEPLPSSFISHSIVLETRHLQKEDNAGTTEPETKQKS